MSASGEHRALVIKIGGAALEAQRESPELWRGVARLARKPGGVVLVHGGGGAVDRMIARLGMTTEKREGIRVTPEDQMEVIAAVLAGAVNKALVGVINAAVGGDGPAVGLSLGDGCAIRTEKTTRYAFDPGRVGDVAGGEGRLLKVLLGAGYLPVVSSIGLDAEGRFLNVNADDAAAGIARVLKAGMLALMTDTPGVRDADGKTMATLDRAAIEGLIAHGTISGGMIPKVRSAARAAGELGAPVVIMSGSPADLAALVEGRPVGTRVEPE